MMNIKENRDCPAGEPNKITGEYFCIAYGEFCKYINDCAVKIDKDKYANT